MMKVLDILRSLLGLSLLIAVVSCTKEESPEPNSPQDPLSDYQFMGEEMLNQGELKVELFLRQEAFVGYNQVAVRISEGSGNTVVSDAQVILRPMMDMGTMMHTTPTGQPEYSSDLEAHLGSATFIMPSTAGDWSFEVLAGAAGATVLDTARFDLEVNTPEEARLYSFVSALDSNLSYFVALKEPLEPGVGMNDLELMIYQRQNMMSFPAATDLIVEIEPEMPSMGHGSDNNEDPVHIAEGLYRGKLNFTMAGHWKVNITVKDQSGASLDNNGFFDITF